MKMLITGATGFLGLNLVNHYKSKDFELSLLDKHPDLFDFEKQLLWNKIKPLIDIKIHTYYYDLTEEAHHTKHLLKNVDTVVHLANVARIEPSWKQYEHYYNTNITATQQFFQLCQEAGVKRFVYVSSSSVYGNNGQEVQTEDGPLCPTNPYAVSKMAAEWALRVQSQRGNTELIIVRPFTMYGSFMDNGDNALVIAKFLKARSKGEPLTIHGDGTQSRDFLHADDAVQGLSLIIEHGKPNEIYNLGSGTTTRIKDLANMIDSKHVLVPHRTGPVQITHANIDKLKLLGYNPIHNIQDWIISQIDH